MDHQETSYFFSQRQIDGTEFDSIIANMDSNKKCIIYGAQKCGQELFLALLFRGKEIEYFVDRNESVQEQEYFYTEVKDPIYLKENYKGEYVVIGSYLEHTRKEIRGFLEEFVGKDNIIDAPVYEYEDELILPGKFLKESKLQRRIHLTNEDEAEVSVVTIVYNTPELYLRRTIESVLQQTYKKFKYIIIEHGCTDDAIKKLIEDYSILDDRISVVHSDKNYVNAMLKGEITDLKPLYDLLGKSITTKYVCMLDSDDYIHKQYLQEAIRQINNHQLNTYFIGGVSYDEEKYSNGNLWPSFAMPPADRIPNNFVEKIFLFANAYSSIGGWAFVTEKDILLKGYEDAWVNTTLSSDLKVGFRVMLESDRCMFGGKVCLYYTNRKGAITSTLQSKISQRLYNLIDLCLIERRDCMIDILCKFKQYDRRVLWRYERYFLMELFRYLEELPELNEMAKHEIRCKLEVIDSDDDISQIIKNSSWIRDEYKVLRKKYDMD